MTTRLFLIRHGNTLDEETKRVYKGRIDIPLSQVGVARMERLATFMSSFKLDRVYTSTLSRSIESGRIVAKAQGLDIEMSSAFDELSFGAWEGLAFEEIRERYPADLARWMENPGKHPPPQGESFRNARKRSMTRLKEIIAADRGRQLAVVAHAGILRIMIFSLLNMKLTGLFRMGQDYGCLSIIDVYDDGNLSLNLLNFTYY